MSKKSIVLIVMLFAILIVGMFVYAHLKQKELAEPISGLALKQINIT